jgi:t-SNARE complex subunit (syntaxin)
VARARARVRFRRECTTTLAGSADLAQNAFTPEQNERVSAQAQEAVRAASGAAQKGKALLEGMKKKAAKLKEEAGDSGSAEMVLHRNQYMELVKAYMSAVSEHQVAKARFKEVAADKMVQQAKVVFEDMSEDAIRDKMEEDPNFVRQRLAEPTLVASSRVQAAYDEAMSRARDVETLVRSLNEVAEMVKDLATLVAQQSALLDRIDMNVETASVRVKKGNKELESAIEYQKKARKRFCCIIICLVVCIVVSLGAALPTALKTG